MEIFWTILFYLIGSISFSFILVKIKAKKDLSKEGSGNLGAKNASRLLGLSGGVCVLILDALKSFIPLSIANLYVDSLELLTFYGLLLILGHNFSIFLRFKGGKGLATGLGLMFFLSPYLAFTTLFAALSFYIITKNTNIAASCAVILYPFFYCLILNSVNGVFVSIATSLIILFKHKEDISKFLQSVDR